MKSKNINAEALADRFQKSKDPKQDLQKLAPLLLLEKEFFFKDKIIASVRGSYEEVHNIYADELSLDKIDELFSGGGLFFGEPLIVLRQMEKLSGGSRGPLAKRLVQKIEAKQAQNLILLSDERSIANSVQKSAAEHGTAVICWPLFDNRVGPWIIKESRSYGLQMDPPAAAVLQQRFGKSLSHLSHALQTIQAALSMKKNTNQVTTQTIDHLFPVGVAVEVFSLVDEVFHGNFSRAMEKLNLILESGQHLIVIIASLAKEITTLNHARLLMGQGLSESEIIAQLRIMKMKQQGFLQELRQFSQKDLNQFLDQLIEIDRKLKSIAQFDGRAELETAIFNIVHKRKQKNSPLRRNYA